MKKELQNQLKEKYQILYPEFDKTKRYNDPILDWGIECGDGWFMILDKIMSWLKFQHLTNGYPKIKIVQIKEKFGMLSFYYENPKFEDSDFKDRQKFNENLSLIRGAVSFATSLSIEICEKCGSTHNVKRTDGNWIRFYCESCRIEEAKIKNHQ